MQIIALNTQTNDDFSLMMNGYFRAGRTKNMENLGFIEKPEYLRPLRAGQTIKNNQSVANKSAGYPNVRQYSITFYTHRSL